MASSNSASTYESYTHIFSVNLNDEYSSFELWLNPNGNLLFIRRSDQSIIITFNLFQISSNKWHFVYVNYDEEQINANNVSISKLNCKISYSLNCAQIVDKEFELFVSLSTPAKNQILLQNSYLFIGHQEKSSSSSQTSTSIHLFNYDLGQSILR